VPNAVQWSATPLLGVLLWVPAFGQIQQRLRPADLRAPRVSITSPASAAQVGGILTMTADASDNVGVVSVQFYADGIAVGLQDFAAPYAVAWDTRGVPNGAHTLTARARDAASNSALSAPIAVDVANASFFQNEILATGFDLPTTIEFLPDGRMLVGEIAGIIRVLPPPYTTPDPTPFLDLDIHISGYAGLQQGIFDIALDPSFTSNRFYYVFYTNDSPNRDRLSRFTANAALDGTVSGSEVTLYEDPQVPDTEHHGGAVHFGNDGKIYFTTGEHFNASNAQDLTSPRGKVHRIDPDGTVPLDNPFHDGAGPSWDSIWAYGMRNPFRAYYDVPTSRLLVADVGGNDYSTAYEEVDLVVRGANYGWPNCELGTCGNPGVTAALYAYPHLGRDASITGGFVYHGSAFPSIYQGRYFFADYTQNWIKCLAFDAQGNVDGVFDFEPGDGASDGPYGDIVHLAEGPDGALYYVDLGYSDVGGTFGTSKIRRIRYIQSNLPPTAIASADPTSGPPPLTVTFSSADSSDPEGQPLTYSWTFGDGATSSAAAPVHVYTEDGPYVARLAVSDGVNTTLGAPFTISVGNAPTCAILTPLPSSTFIAGDEIAFGGDASDSEDGVLPASAYLWNIDFLHEGHVHPGLVQSGVKSGTFTIPTSGHDFSGDTRYRISLRVTDSDGLQASAQVSVYPQKVALSFDTLPSGLTLYLDGIAKATPFVHDALVDFHHSVEARNSSTGTTIYTFQSWSDGGAQLHTITVPASDQSYTATYTAAITMGETTVFGSVDSGNGNLLLVQDAVLSQTATLQSLSFNVVTAAGSLRLGIYDATGPSGGPGTLKAQTSSFVPVVGWNTRAVLTPVSLSAGNYWLAYFPSSSSLAFATNFSIGSYKATSLAFGPMPATFPANPFGGTTHWSLYGTLTP
jgi:glucose/arabinose dehydrogenase/PKD repeat protein